MLHRRDFLKASTVLATGFARAAPRNPNLLVILADRYSAQTLAPSLQRLAKQGVRFERCYTANPLNSPAQAALITGRFPHACGVTTNNVRLPRDQSPIATQLNQAGYKTAFIGNWFSDSAPQDSPLDFLKLNKANRFCLLLAMDAARDDYLARLLNAMEELHLADDTIVLFTSCYGQGGANLPSEESVRVPLIIRCPRLLPAGRKYDFLVSSVDLMPTLLNLCGQPVPDQVQGQDLSTLFANGQGARPESIYAEGQLGEPGEWRMLVRGLDKLVVDRELNVTHLYNLGQDPSEMENLVHDPSHELKCDEMKALLKDWMRRTGDRMDPSGLKKRF